MPSGAQSPTSSSTPPFRPAAARSSASRPRDGWPEALQDEIEAYLPQSERHELIAELRSLTQGLGVFEAAFDHLAELTGRQADEVVAAAKAAA